MIKYQMIDKKNLLEEKYLHLYIRKICYAKQLEKMLEISCI